MALCLCICLPVLLGEKSLHIYFVFVLKTPFKMLPVGCLNGTFSECEEKSLESLITETLEGAVISVSLMYLRRAKPKGKVGSGK